jgi:host factor-I protein
MEKSKLHEPLPSIARKSSKEAEKANLQDVFLNAVRKQKITTTVFLINGVKLQGVITWFDQSCLLLKRKDHSEQTVQLVYKHAISTVMPMEGLVWPDTDSEI